MKEEILNHLNDPSKLEKLYRSNRAQFKRDFSTLYQELKGNVLADFWHERLNYESNEISWGTSKELFVVIIASLLAGLIAKVPMFFSVNEDFFYSRNIGFVIFPILSAYFAWKNKLSTGKITFIAGAMLAGLIFINCLPNVSTSDTLILSCIHLALYLWSVLGFSFVGNAKGNEDKRLGFLKYNGDLIVMTGLILIAGMLMSGLTVGLFSLIGFHIERFYFKNIAIFGLAAAPIVATYLTQTNPQLVGKVSPVIAKLFSPLVLVMLIVYLVAIIYSPKNPYNDREFLMMFNALLVGVMAIIFFSVAERSKATENSTQIWILFLLSIVTIVINGVALSAILFRISEWGLTPNRTAILGGNILILVNLVLVTMQLFKVVAKRSDITVVGKVIALYLPVYFVWTIIVTFLFPLIFGFK
jgi:hypothetical protein